MPSLTYLPSHRPCPHPHTPHPTEPAPSDCRNRHTVKEHKGGHTGPATMAATLGGRGGAARCLCKPFGPFQPQAWAGGQGASLQISLSQGGLTSVPQIQPLAPPLLHLLFTQIPKCRPCRRTRPGKDDTGASNQGGAVEDEAPEDKAPKLCPSFLSQVCVCWKECSQLQEAGEGWTFKLLETE